MSSSNNIKLKERSSNSTLYANSLNHNIQYNRHSDFELHNNLINKIDTRKSLINLHNNRSNNSIINVNNKNVQNNSPILSDVNSHVLQTLTEAALKVKNYLNIDDKFNNIEDELNFIEKKKTNNNINILTLTGGIDKNSSSSEDLSNRILRKKSKLTKKNKKIFEFDEESDRKSINNNNKEKIKKVKTLNEKDNENKKINKFKKKLFKLKSKIKNEKDNFLNVDNINSSHTHSVSSKSLINVQNLSEEEEKKLNLVNNLNKKGKKKKNFNKFISLNYTNQLDVSIDNSDLSLSNDEKDFTNKNQDKKKTKTKILSLKNIKINDNINNNNNIEKKSKKFVRKKTKNKTIVNTKNDLELLKKNVLDYDDYGPNFKRNNKNHFTISHFNNRSSIRKFTKPIFYEDYYQRPITHKFNKNYLQQINQSLIDNFNKSDEVEQMFGLKFNKENNISNSGGRQEDDDKDNIFNFIPKTNKNFLKFNNICEDLKATIILSNPIDKNNKIKKTNTIVSKKTLNEDEKKLTTILSKRNSLNKTTTIKLQDEVNQIKKEINFDNNSSNIIDDGANLEEEEEKENEKLLIEYQYRKLTKNKDLIYDSLSDIENLDDLDGDFYIDPNGYFKLFFDMIICFLILISCFAHPVYFAFNSFNRIELKSFYSQFDFVCDFFCLLDLFLGFITGYFDSEEQLIGNNYMIIRHYFFSWFLFDLVISIPFNTIFNLVYYYKYLDKKIFIFMDDPYSLLLIFRLVRLMKLLKIYLNNSFFELCFYYVSQYDILIEWSGVIFFLFIFLLGIHVLSCVFIFLAHVSFPNFISAQNTELNREKVDIYVIAFYFTCATFFTVGYGDIVSINIYELFYNLFLLVFGNMIYSYTVSVISNYVFTANSKSLDYQKKLEILDQIRLTHEKMPTSLYDKINKFLLYKLNNDKGDSNGIIDNLPISLRNKLIMEMYKDVINNFVFFKNFNNADFIIRVLLAFKPLQALKNERLVNEGDYIEEIIFVKRGRLSLNLPLPVVVKDKTLQKMETLRAKTTFRLSNGNVKKNSLLNNLPRRRSSLFNKMENAVPNEIEINEIENTAKEIELNMHNNLNENKDNIQDIQKLREEIKSNQQYIKIIEIRRNEHFGDIYMWMNKRSPLCVKVKSKVCEILLLKKTDAVKISSSYPKIWRKIIKKSIFNIEQIEVLINKTLKFFYIHNEGKKIMKRGSVAQNAYFRRDPTKTNKLLNTNNILTNIKNEENCKLKSIPSEDEEEDEEFEENEEEEEEEEEESSESFEENTDESKNNNDDNNIENDSIITEEDNDEESTYTKHTKLSKISKTIELNESLSETKREFERNFTGQLSRKKNNSSDEATHRTNNLALSNNYSFITDYNNNEDENELNSNNLNVKEDKIKKENESFENDVNSKELKKIMPLNFLHSDNNNNKSNNNNKNNDNNNNNNDKNDNNNDNNNNINFSNNILNIINYLNSDKPNNLTNITNNNPNTNTKRIIYTRSKDDKIFVSYVPNSMLNNLNIENNNKTNINSKEFINNNNNNNNNNNSNDDNNNDDDDDDSEISVWETSFGVLQINKTCEITIYPTVKQRTFKPKIHSHQSSPNVNKFCSFDKKMSQFPKNVTSTPKKFTKKISEKLKLKKNNSNIKLVSQFDLNNNNFSNKQNTIKSEKDIINKEKKNLNSILFGSNVVERLGYSEKKSNRKLDMITNNIEYNINNLNDPSKFYKNLVSNFMNNNSINSKGNANENQEKKNNDSKNNLINLININDNNNNDNDNDNHSYRESILNKNSIVKEQMTDRLNNIQKIIKEKKFNKKK